MDISQAFSALSAITDIATKLIGAHADLKVREQAISLTAHILALQRSLAELHAENFALQQAQRESSEALARREEWDLEAADYALHELAPGVFAYTAKPERRRQEEPAHHLCAACYQQRRKSILQRVGKSSNGTLYRCHACAAEVLDHKQRTASEVASIPKDWGPYL